MALIDASRKHLLQFACKNNKKPFHFQTFYLHYSVCNNIVISKTPFSYYFKENYPLQLATFGIFV